MQRVIDANNDEIESGKKRAENNDLDGGSLVVRILGGKLEFPTRCDR